MATSTKYYIGFLILVILSASVYIMLPNKVRIDVSPTTTTFKVYENKSWVVSASETIKLYNGTKLIYAKSRQVKYITENNITYISRFVDWGNNITMKTTYVFDGNKDNVELVPMRTLTECTNCQGKIIQFEYRKITYDGKTTDITSPFSFGHKMKLSWTGAYYSKVTNSTSDKITIKYKATKPYEVYNVRLFDPEGSIIAYKDLKKYEALCTPVYGDVTTSIPYDCEVTKETPIYKTEEILDKNGTMYNKTTLVGYDKEVIKTTCYNSVTSKEQIDCKPNGVIKVNDVLIDEPLFKCGIDGVCDEYTDTHQGGGDGNGNMICEQGETCKWY